MDIPQDAPLVIAILLLALSVILVAGTLVWLVIEARRTRNGSQVPWRDGGGGW